MRAMRLAFLVVVSVLVACSSDDRASPPADDGGPATALDLTNLAPGTWKWFEIPGAVCRDGSPAGFGLNLGGASSKLMIYLEGGGACFNEITCASNPAKVTVTSATRGILERRAENPVGDWTHVYVPYCTGDVHAGNNPAGDVPGVGPQRFVGYSNMGRFLGKLAATFPATSRVLLTGVSAGGFGSAANYGQVVRAFPSTPVNLVDDAGPAMRDPYLARCLQDRWTELFGLDRTVLAECGADCAGQPSPLFAATVHWTKLRPGDAQGLVSTTGDDTIRGFFGFGADTCTSYERVTEADYAAGLADIRAQHAAPRFGTLVYAGTTHTILGGAGFYTTDPARPFTSWLRAIVESDTVTNVGP